LATRQHHFGQWVEHFYCYWKKLGRDRPETNPNDSLDKFAEWLEVALKNPNADPNVARILSEEVEHCTKLTIKPFDTTKHNLDKVQRFLEGVKYICKEADRIKYLVRARSGQLFRREELFDTFYHSTVFSGTDWAIWVRAPNGNFYSHSHKVARFHHSSFLAGGMVRGAGEWSVTCGKIKKISGKSGHYQPTMKALWESAHWLNALGVFHRQATVILYKRGSSRGTEVPIGTFLTTDWAETLQDWKVDRHSSEPAPAPKVAVQPPPIAPAASITPPLPSRTIDDAEITIGGYVV
jgi:hypothetical protein